MRICVPSGSVAWVPTWCPRRLRVQASAVRRSRPRERYGVSVRYPFGIRSAAWWASVDLTRDVPWLNPLKKRQMRSISVSGFLETPLAGGAKDRSRILHLECYGNGIDEEDAEAGLKPLV